jgi:hypothetical protein
MMPSIAAFQPKFVSAISLDNRHFTGTPFPSVLVLPQSASRLTEPLTWIICRADKDVPPICWAEPGRKILWFWSAPVSCPNTQVRAAAARDATPLFRLSPDTPLVSYKVRIFFHFASKKADIITHSR